jgi:hypothetical protein
MLVDPVRRDIGCTRIGAVGAADSSSVELGRPERRDRGLLDLIHPPPPAFGCHNQGVVTVAMPRRPRCLSEGGIAPFRTGGGVGLGPDLISAIARIREASARPWSPAAPPPDSLGCRAGPIAGPGRGAAEPSHGTLRVGGVLTGSHLSTQTRWLHSVLKIRQGAAAKVTAHRGRDLSRPSGPCSDVS